MQDAPLIPPDESRLLAFLDSLGIASTTRRHPPVYTVEEAKALRGDIPGGHCKNLFLKDKKDQLWLVVALEERPIDLKSLDKRIGAARLSFGKAELLREVLGVEPGSVTPFALLNDAAGRVRVVLDRGMMQIRPLNYHPMHNAATTTIQPEDLARFLAATGHEALVVDL
jgi:Ala-tRNA(Pro) deacylase